MFERLTKAGLTLRAEKYTIGANKCSFLGHTIGGGCIRPLEAKISAVTNFARPTTKQDLRAFLGLTGYYRKFIPQYATRTVHLTDALGGKRPDSLIWTDEIESEFIDLKSAITSRPVLRSPDFELFFILQTDASLRGIGAVLSQNF